VRGARALGYDVKASTVSKDRHGFTYRDSENEGDLSIAVGPDRYQIRIGNATERIAREPTANEVKWGHTGTRYENAVSSRLKTSIVGDRWPEIWGSTWTDASETPLEQELPFVIREIELRAEQARLRREEERLRLLARQTAWDRACDRAVAKAIEAHRADLLLDQVRRWEEVKQLREYIAVLRSRLSEPGTNQVRTGGEQWITWAEHYVESIDPLLQHLEMPSDPEITQDLLEPFMHGYTRYRP
jgi:hypothetical protein